MNAPYGYCQCGCGEMTKIAERTRRNRGWLKGEPKPYISGAHAGRKSGQAWVAEDRGYLTPCHIWQRALSGHGYGIIRRGGVNRPAHRVLWEEQNGPAPDDLDLDHLCRVHPCVNLTHLELVSHAVNMQRGVVTRLTTEQAMEIRLRRIAGERTLALAEEFGISQRHVYMIASGECWPNLGARVLKEAAA